MSGTLIARSPLIDLSPRKVIFGPFMPAHRLVVPNPLRMRFAAFLEGRILLRVRSAFRSDVLFVMLSSSPL